VPRPPREAGSRPGRGKPRGREARPRPDARTLSPHPHARRAGGAPSTAQTSIPRPRRERAARRSDRVEASPTRIIIVATSGPGSSARPAAPLRGAAGVRVTPEPGCFPSRRSVRRHARQRILLPAGGRPGRPTGPARQAHRHRPPPGPLHPEGHRRPEDGQRPDGSGPTRRHAKDPFRRSKSSGMCVVGAGLRASGRRNEWLRGPRFESPGIVHNQS
jgi:hypothetical protein